MVRDKIVRRVRRVLRRRDWDGVWAFVVEVVVVVGL